MSVRRPTVADLVRKTGCSPGTISRAFNGRVEVSPETRARILKAAEEIGYRPSSSARSFKTGKTHRWGILLPHLINPYYAELFEYLDLQVRERSQVPYLALSHRKNEKEEQQLRDWGSGEVDAVIVDPLGSRETREMLNALQSWNIPVVLLHDELDGRFDSLVHDFRPSLLRALQYLTRIGHRQVAYVGNQHPRARSRSHYEAFQRALAGAGVRLDVASEYFIADDDEDAGRGVIREWLRLRPRPTAMVCANDSMAMSIMNHCPAHGVVVPRDLSILGRDDLRLAGAIGLSTIRTDRRLAALKVAEMVKSRLEQRDRPVEHAVLPSEFVVRASLARPLSP